MMRDKLFSFFLALSILGIISCRPTVNPEKEQEKAVLNDIMAVHDKVMPQMGELNTLQQKLYADAKHVTDATLKQTYTSAAEKLEKADDAMMDWMGQFKGSFEGMTHDQIMTYLNTQKVKVSEMQLIFDKNMQEAKQLFEKK
jgi:hypothetical protein